MRPADLAGRRLWPVPGISLLVLPAAPAGHAELEDFLLREFFGTPLRKRAP